MAGGDIDQSSHPPVRVPVVAMVASVGGLGAVTTALAGLSEQIEAALLVLIHQEPDRISQLPEILARNGPLPARHAEDGEALLPGHLLVAPPGRHLLITPQRRTALLVSGDFPPNRPSADLLLVSMALSLGQDAIAVILSGRGHDGATGATAVHDFGGRVLTADEASSKEFGMPAATIARGDTVDETLPVEQLGTRINELVRPPAT